MSLHKFADMVAKQGRGDDSLLIHMTPDEVQRLQSFAEANGRSLTINPETGLPEAGMLSDLFKAVAPIALGAFLGPAGMGLTFGGLSSAVSAGIATGGITALATGSLSRGLMAGLGAYGGAGLGESLMNAGSASLATQAMTPELMEQAAGAGANYDQLLASEVGAKTAASTPFETLKAGASAVTDSGTSAMQFAKQNLGNISAAAAPIMAGAMVPTTTKMPENTNPAYIRQKLYDPYTQTYKSLAPVKASEWGNRNFSDAYTNPQTGQMATLDQRQPTPMAGGGIVALAGGGVPGYALGGTLAADLERTFVDAQKSGDYSKVNDFISANQVSNADIQNQWKGLDTSGLAGLGVNLYNPNTAQVPEASTTQTTQNAASTPAGSAGLQWFLNHDKTADDYYGHINSALATNKNATDAAIDAAMLQSGISNEDVAEALRRSNGSLAMNYAIGAGNMGLSGLNTNITSWVDKARQDPSFKAMSAEQQQQAARDAMATVSMNEADVVRATGKTIAELFPKTVTKQTTVIPGGYYGNITGNPLTTTPGDIINNADGTVTVVPNIPGRPDGGFTGMGQVRDVYTEGGGSLGYTAKAPKTIEEFNQLYNKQTGDSLAAYDYLMGKGGGKYPVQSQAASTGEGIMRPYWSAGMRYKPKFLSYSKDGTIKSSTTSGTPADVKAADLTTAKTIEVTDSSGESTQTYTAVLQDDGTYLAGNGKRYDVTGKQVAAGGGMMGYAMGGGLGSLGSYSDGGRLLKGPGDGVSDSIPATIGAKGQPARLADGEFVIPARIVSELGNGSTEAGARKLYAMMDRVQKARGKTTGKNKVAANTRADKHLPA